MRCRQAIGLSAAAVVGAASAASLSVPVSRQPFGRGLAGLKRDNGDGNSDGETIDLQALNNITGGGYYAEFAVGTPPQNISFLLDTGSSDTWVNSVESNLCTSTTMQSQLGFCLTQFNPDNSSSFEEVQEGGFDITYLDGRNIQGDYFADTIVIGDGAIEKQQLGLALHSVRPTGIMGLGFGANVVADTVYPTIIDNLVKQGFIDYSAYSLYLNDLSTDAGSILFGGIDKAKYTGDLASLPLVSESPEGSEVTSFNVQLQGFDVIDPDGGSSIELPELASNAILDSGSTISLLPDEQVQPVWDKFGVHSFSDIVAPFVDCAYAGEKGAGYKFEFKFSGKTIEVEMNEMIVDAYREIQDILLSDPDLNRLFADWEGICMFGLGTTADFGIQGNDFSLLGATFLRSAYVVYDLGSKQVAIAQSNLNSTESDIVEITGDGLTALEDVQVTSAADNDNSASILTSSLLKVVTLITVLGTVMAL
jgi:hypothetical protein